jgi:tumor protein p53-inducible protein 3
MEATAVNRADTLQRKGLYPSMKGVTNIIGLECSGYLLNSLEDLKHDQYKKNRKVMALLSGGGYADIVKVRKTHVMDIPSGFNFEEAAAIPETWLTAF